MGARLLADWLTSPLTHLEPIAERHEAVGELLGDSMLRSDLRSSLGQAYDLERLAARVGTGRATPRDLGALARTLALLPKIRARLTARSSKRLNQLEAALELCPEVRAAIEAALVEDPPLTIKEGADPRGVSPRPRRAPRDCPRREEVDRQVPGRADPPDGDRQPQGWLQQGLRLLHRDQPRARLEGPPDFIRKQTVKNAERYITPELKEYEDKVLRAEDRANELEYELFTTLRDRVAAEGAAVGSGGSRPVPGRRALRARRARGRGMATAAPRW